MLSNIALRKGAGYLRGAFSFDSSSTFFEVDQLLPVDMTDHTLPESSITLALPFDSVLRLLGGSLEAPGLNFGSLGPPGHDFGFGNAFLKIGRFRIHALKIDPYPHFVRSATLFQRRVVY